MIWSVLIIFLLGILVLGPIAFVVAFSLRRDVKRLEAKVLEMEGRLRGDVAGDVRAAEGAGAVGVAVTPPGAGPAASVAPLTRPEATASSAAGNEVSPSQATARPRCTPRARRAWASTTCRWSTRPA